MRKILASFLAAAMVASIGATMSFAADPNKAAHFVLDLNGITVPTGSGDAGNPQPNITGAPIGNGLLFDAVGTTYADAENVDFTVTLDLGTPVLTLYNGSTPIGEVDLGTNNVLTTQGQYRLINASAANTNAGVSATVVTTAPSITENAFIDALAGQTFSHLDIDGKLYSGRLTRVKVGSTDGIQVAFNDSANVPNFTDARLSFPNATTNVSPNSFRYVNADNTTGAIEFNYTRIAVPTITAQNVYAGSGDVTADAKQEGITIKDAVVCDGEGNPIPLSENGRGVDNDINDADGVQSDSTVYFMIKEYAANGIDKSHYDDDRYYKIKVSKGDNSKQVKSAEVVYKNFSNTLYDVTKNQKVSGTNGRHRFIKVVLNPNYTTDEYKITLDMRITPTSDAVDKGYSSSSDELKIKDFSFYMKNIERAADNDWRVGVNGLMLKPLENDWNDVTWFDEDGDVAHMKFFADSDIDSFYSKLSTKWDHGDYAAYFNDQDAFIFNFTGSPKLSSTSRADLEIYNPFVDEDGNETIDPSTAVIYQIIDGDLFNVTDSFQYKEGENGDMAFVTRTRFLGTYVICEKEIEEAVSDETVPDELTPDTTEAPEDVTPDSNAGGKQPANTGKYL